MTPVLVRLLLLEDKADDAGLLQSGLATYAPGEFVITQVKRLADALKRIKNEQFDLVLSDLELPDSTGLATVQAIVACAPDLPLVVLTGSHDEDLGNAAIRNGAQDYLVKGESSATLLARSLRYSIERARLQRVQRGDSEERYHTLVELSSDWYWEQDENLRFTRMSRPDAGQLEITLNTFLGHTRREAPGVVWDESDLVTLETIAAARQSFRDFEIGRIYGNGPKHYVRMSGEPIFDVSGTFKGYRGVGTDITERKTTEMKFQQLTQLYAALSQCNQAIVRCASEEELFPQLCQAAVRYGGMKMAWIGMVELSSRTIRFAARAGERVEEYLQDVEISVDADSPLGLGPTGVAFREDHPVWCQDFRNDPTTAPWHERSARFGWSASASLPLHRNGVPVGVLTLLATAVGAFDEAAQNLLSEMATDISFALDNFSRSSARERAEEQVQHQLKQLESAFMSTVEVATTLSEMRDPYTAGHERRVGKIAAAIGAELGLGAQRQEGLRVAGYLHDIGKIMIPAEILSKPGRLSAIEFQLIQAHARASYDVLKDVEFPWPVAQVALQHHERMDGSGYPQGLKGEAILFETRIVAVADVIEAMSSHRPYRVGLGIVAALAEIERGSGSVYDQVVADACLRLFREKGYVVPA